VDNAWEQENAEARKCLKMPQNPTRQVHALFGGVLKDGFDFAFSILSKSNMPKPSI
jgi:hypothetical protein